MIVQNIYLQKYEWFVTIYYAVSGYYRDAILQQLQELDCDKKHYIDAKHMIDECAFNCGFTYSNLQDKETVIVIGLTTSPSEFYNTLEHEKGHLIAAISEVYDIDLQGEELQYLLGNISKKVFPIARKFLCNHCRQELDLFSK